jgi:hypothetical protein
MSIVRPVRHAGQYSYECIRRKYAVKLQNVELCRLIWKDIRFLNKVKHGFSLGIKATDCSDKFFQWLFC